jgi:HEAT repeat protein
MSSNEWDRVVEDLNDVDDVEKMVRAVERLEELSTRAHLPALNLLMDHDSFFVREAAAVPIARLEGLEALPRLLRARWRGEREGHDNDNLVHVITCLVEDEGDRVGPVLLRMFASSSEADRADAAWLAGFAYPHVPLDAMLDLLNDKSSRVRGGAVGSIATYKGDDRAYHAMLQCLADPDEQVRVDAASSLGYYGNPAAIASLEAALADPSPRVRDFARWAIDKLRAPK